jgi:hypothetical protein
MKVYNVVEGYWQGALLNVPDDASFSPPWMPMDEDPPTAEPGQFVIVAGGVWQLTFEPPAAQTAAALATAIKGECDRIDAESFRRKYMDFQYDFGSAPGVQDDGTVVAASGVRSLQMQLINRDDWRAQQGRSLEYKVASKTKPILVRASDNLNILCPAQLFLDCFEAGALRDEAYLTYRTARKFVVRACTTIVQVNDTKAATDAGWATAYVP